MTALARDHHTLPVFYLKRFADDQGRLSKWDKASDTWAPIRPKSAAVEIDFYIVETEEGPSDAIENSLSRIEGRAAEVIRMIEKGTWPVPPDAKAQLAEFLSLQRVRSTGYRASVNRFTDEVMGKVYYLEEIARFQRKFIEENKRPPTGDELKEHARTIKKPGPVAMSQNAAIEAMLKMAGDQERLAIYQHRSWNLECANDGALVTADSPLSLWSSTSSSFWGEGELTADEIAFPVDPHTCLVLRHPDIDEVVTDIDVDRVHELNRRGFEHAHRSVFATPGTEKQLI